MKSTIIYFKYSLELWTGIQCSLVVYVLYMLWRFSCFCLYMCIKVRSQHHVFSSTTSPPFYLLQFLRQNISLNIDLRPASSSFLSPSSGVTRTWLCIRLFMGFCWVKVVSYLKASTLQIEHFPIPNTDFVFKFQKKIILPKLSLLCLCHWRWLIISI